MYRQGVSVKSIFKLVLRTTKQIYNIFQNGLFVACTLINDISLLSVDVIQRTVVSQDEDIYIGLRQSALNSRNSIRRKTYVDPRSKPRGRYVKRQLRSATDQVIVHRNILKPINYRL